MMNGGFCLGFLTIVSWIRTVTFHHHQEESVAYVALILPAALSLGTLWRFQHWAALLYGFGRVANVRRFGFNFAERQLRVAKRDALQWMGMMAGSWIVWAILFCNWR